MKAKFFACRYSGSRSKPPDQRIDPRPVVNVYEREWPRWSISAEPVGCRSRTPVPGWRRASNAQRMHKRRPRPKSPNGGKPREMAGVGGLLAREMGCAMIDCGNGFTIKKGVCYSPHRA
ncbi:unnamed protein product, partial [Iphiclides podalirius]